jgi:hypothetical protein
MQSEVGKIVLENRTSFGCLRVRGLGSQESAQAG